MPPRQRRVGAYAKLLANYASDDALIEAGEAAELLFCRGLAFLATSDSDGFITDSQVVRYVGAGMRDAMKRADRLATVGVWERVDGGYIVRSWTKIHESAEEKGRRLKADRERKRVIPLESEGIPDGIQGKAAPESLSLIHDSAVTEHDQEQEREGNPPDDDADSPFCPPHRPDGTTEKCGPCGTYRVRWQAKQQREAANFITRSRAAAVRQTQTVLADIDDAKARAVPRAAVLGARGEAS